MKLTKQNVLDYKAMNGLQQYVKDYVLDRWDDYDDKRLIFQEVLEHGCQSRIVSSLIYYSDTLKFFDTYREEIKVLLKDIMDEVGVGSPKDSSATNGTKAMYSLMTLKIKTCSRGSRSRKR